MKIQIGVAMRKRDWPFLIRLNILLQYDPSISFYLSKVHAKPEHENLGSLFIIAKTWKQPTWPSVHEWTNKLQYI